GRVLPCAVWMKGHYGLNDLFIGAPARLGKNGVEEIIEVQLSDDERALLHASAGEVRKDIDALQEMWAQA
ncbi:MAG TPA: malate dehydrogenase, partial [Rhodothermales bacterium]|nr:malate dehydrogenase [Rhodothermales bacterium]